MALTGDEPTDLPHLSAKAMAGLATVVDAADAVEACLAGGYDPELGLLRTHAEVPAGELLLMPIALDRSVGLKLVSIAPGNPASRRPLVQAVYLLLDGVTLTPAATLDGTYLTTLRTAAVSALVARRLARPDAGRLVIFGAGVQAWAHAQSLAQVLPLTHVDVVGRSTDRAEALAAKVRDELGIPASCATPDAVADADVIACCTTARSPLFEGQLLGSGATVLAIGAYQPDTREVDDETMRRGVVVVESRRSALAEAGEIVQSIAAGVLVDSELITLSDLVLQRPDLPADAVRVFKGTGMPWQDLAVAGMFAERAGLLVGAAGQDETQAEQGAWTWSAGAGSYRAGRRSSSSAAVSWDCAPPTNWRPPASATSC